MSCASPIPRSGARPNPCPHAFLAGSEYDGRGHVTVLSVPDRAKAVHEAEVRMPYGTDVTVPEGPAKGFVIGVAIAGGPREG